MVSLKNYRWRKATDINREFALFELMTDNVILLDIGFSEEGILEIAFHDGIAGLIVEWSKFKEIIEQGKKLAEADR